MNNNATRREENVTQNIVFLYSYLIIRYIRDSGNGALNT